MIYTALAVLLIVVCVALGGSGAVRLGRSRRPAFALAAAMVAAQLALLLLAR